MSSIFRPSRTQCQCQPAAVTTPVRVCCLEHGVSARGVTAGIFRDEPLLPRAAPSPASSPAATSAPCFARPRNPSRSSPHSCPRTPARLRHTRSPPARASTARPFLRSPPSRLTRIRSSPSPCVFPPAWPPPSVPPMPPLPPLLLPILLLLHQLHRRNPTHTCPRSWS